MTREYGSFDSTSALTESHRPHGTLTRPVGDLVQRRQDIFYNALSEYLPSDIVEGTHPLYSEGFPS